MKHMYCAFLDSASSAFSAGINKSEINIEYQTNFAIYIEDFEKHEFVIFYHCYKHTLKLSVT